MPQSAFAAIDAPKTLILDILLRARGGWFRRRRHARDSQNSTPPTFRKRLRERSADDKEVENRHRSAASEHGIMGRRHGGD